MTRIVFDTTILIDFLRKKLEAKKVLADVELGKTEGFISSITEAELFAGQDVKVERKKQAVQNLITLFEKILVTNEIAQKAGEFKRKYYVPLDDCVIAATAAIQNAKLWTKNVEDFKKIREIEIEEPY